MNLKSIILVSVFAIVAYISWSFFPYNVVHSQEILQCGQPISGEFVKSAEAKFYQIQMSALDSFEVLVDPAGDQLGVSLVLFDPTDRRFKAEPNVSKSPTISSGELSATGLYKIQVSNSSLQTWSRYQPSPNQSTGPGFYTLVVKCTLSNGDVIEPGATDGQTPLPNPSNALPTVNVTPSFLEIGANYQITTYSGNFFVTIIEIENNGWAKVNLNDTTAWLNLNQVLFVTPVE
ncbi:MAG: hypothetical protein KDJ52_24010 [Anaerolineae bacterium]|nr:hypothetical protein [Anaerolineae bacterium]